MTHAKGTLRRILGVKQVGGSGVLLSAEGRPGLCLLCVSGVAGMYRISILSKLREAYE